MLESELEQKRERRRRRFGFALGLLLALLIHALILWGPKIHYRPVMESLTRAIVAKPFRPVEAYEPPPGRPLIPAPNEGNTPPPPATTALPAPLAGDSIGEESSPASSPAAIPPPPDAVVGEAEAPLSPVPKKYIVPTTPPPQPAPQKKAAPADKGKFEDLLGQLASQRGEIDARNQKGWSGAGDGDGIRRAEAEKLAREAKKREEEAAAAREMERLLDKRIRVVINTYPPTTIQTKPLPIHYPDSLTVKKKNFKEGVCRVYYRVKTDRFGKIVKREIKTPATKEAQEHFGIFIDAVTSEVDNWPFEEVEADIHVDVYFTIDL